MKKIATLTAVTLSLFAAFRAEAQFNTPFNKPQRKSTDQPGHKATKADSSNISVVKFFKKDNYLKNDYVDEFYKKIYGDNATSTVFLQTVNTQLFGKNTYIAPEFLSFFCHNFPTRFGIGGSFKVTGDTAADNKTASKLQNILQNGGNLFFDFDFPIVFHSSSDDNFHFGLSLTNNWSFNSTSNFGSDTSTIGLTWQPGLKIHNDLAFFDTQDNKGALASLDIQLCYFTGSQSFLNKLNTSDFGLLQMKFSLSTKSISFFASYPIWSSSTFVRDNLRQIKGGISISPTNLLKN